jgi:signal transduction histidine kinase
MRSSNSFRDSKSSEERKCQTRRTQLIGQLAGSVVHDLNNIFAALMGMLEQLAEAVRMIQADAMMRPSQQSKFSSRSRCSARNF